MHTKTNYEDGFLDAEFLEALGIDLDRPKVDKYVDFNLDPIDIEVTDTDGRVIGVVDLTHDWIRL